MTDNFGNQPPENFPPNENPAQQPPADQFGAPQQGFPAAQQPPADQFGAPQQEFPAAQQPPADQFGAPQQGFPPPQQGYPQQAGGQFGGAHPATGPQENKKILSGILALLLGSLGVHKFMLGYTTEGVIMACVTVLTCGFGALITGPIALIEGILYLIKSDEEFYYTYQVNKKGWF